MASILASTAGSISPSTSPRLPSPPPFPEVQIAPKSPIYGTTGSIAAQDADEAAMLKIGATRRIRPGTKASEMASGPPLVPLSELDSSFQLQEHLKALYFHATKTDESHTAAPITRETALLIAKPPENIDASLWLYELCRFLVQKANSLIVGFFSDSPPCSSLNCPEMRASEWQYLCAVHDPPKSCCAIDYCCHTLDWASNILTSQKHFPSRLSLGSESGGGNQQSVRQLTNIFRRVYRMFAHAWFQHREVFWSLENQEGLYIFYKTVCDVHNLIPEDSYTVPPEAEGIATDGGNELQDEHRPQQELNSSVKQSRLELGSDNSPLPQDKALDTKSTNITAATTRRHKHTPSMGSIVTTIAEGDEETDEIADSHIPLDTADKKRPTINARASSPLLPIFKSLPSSSPEDIGVAQTSSPVTSDSRKETQTEAEKLPEKEATIQTSAVDPMELLEKNSELQATEKPQEKEIDSERKDRAEAQTHGKTVTGNGVEMEAVDELEVKGNELGDNLMKEADVVDAIPEETQNEQEQREMKAKDGDS